ncbi:MAG: FtsX-like permease family protein [Chitinophagaceae bacterium]|nr:MAG: FtsX-like permease family protein [Chitinophagaceae bacterium]
MIRNYLIMAFRNMNRHRAFAFINIAGLAVGIASCIVLFLVVKYELSYDQFLPGHQQVYHVVTKQVYPDRVHYQPGVATPALDALRTDFPDLATGAIYHNSGGQVTALGKDPNKQSDQKYIEGAGIMFADPQFFTVFPYTWLSGSPSVLSEPNTVVLTRKMATKYFGNWKEAQGQYLRIDNALTMRVAGILEDVPLNTDFPLAVVPSLISSKNNPELYGYDNDWGSMNSNFQVFVRLPANVSAASLDARMQAFSKKYYTEGRSVKSNFLQPLSDIHFNKEIESFGDHSISKATLWSLSLVGVFIILMACINFVNMSTAQAVNRSKEIGIRKVLGSRRSSLFGQMMGETAAMVFIALLLGVVLAALCLPYVKYVASIEEPLSVFNPQVLLFALVLGVLVSFLAGSYPALVVSGFNPLLALKNKFSSASVAGVSLRRVLVVTQFAISQALIIGTIIAVTQMGAIKNADIGFNKDAVMVISAPGDSVIQSRQQAFKSALLANPQVKAVSFSSDVPSSDNNWSNNFAFDHKEDENFHLFLKYADQDYFNTYGIEFIAGHGFSKSDTVNGYVVNQTLLKKLGIQDPQSVIGKDIRRGGGQWFPIVGVVKDFRTNSMRDDIVPLAIASWRDVYSASGIKISGTDFTNTTAFVQTQWNKFFPEYANTSSFMDERIADFYRQEDQLALLYKIFAGIAIFISCLGLYGLVSFMAVQRTREVGIRKTLGASVGQIVYLFSKEFTLLVIIAFAVAAPLAWLFMNKWLQNFTYKINVGAGIFVLAIVISMVIAWITVGYKSLRAALANPVKSLRNE